MKISLLLSSAPAEVRVRRQSGCTAPCEVLGTGPPLWSLIDPANPATGGVSVTYWGVPSLPGDPFPCPADNITGELLY